MSTMKSDEMQIIKCASMKLTDDTVMIVSLQYHSERDDLNKVIHDKSVYRWLAQIMKIDDANALVAKMKSDAERLNPWKWENDPSWHGKMYTKDSTNYAGGTWLAMKLKKATDWETGQNVLKGWKNSAHDFVPSAKYEIDDYICPDGTKISLSDKNALLEHVGEILWKPILHKIRKNSSKPSADQEAA